MYVAKVSRNGHKLTASVYYKIWSEEFMSNQVELIEERDFLLRYTAKKWINSTICKNLVKHRRLEIVDEW